MNEQEHLKSPTVLENIQLDSKALGFEMACDAPTGSLLKTLAASKPGGKFLELGTGTGVSTAWLLDGMDQDSNILSIENNINSSCGLSSSACFARRVSTGAHDKLCGSLLCEPLPKLA